MGVLKKFYSTILENHFQDAEKTDDCVDSAVFLDLYGDFVWSFCAGAHQLGSGAGCPVRIFSPTVI